MYKKCTFAKLGSKKQPKKNTKKSKALSPGERAKELSKWRNSWSKQK